jgi:hypothetical protein
MTTLPAQMIDRWHNRAEPGPGESDVYWLWDWRTVGAVRLPAPAQTQH